MLGGRILLSFLSFGLLLNGSFALAQRFQDTRNECVRFINAHRQGEVSPTSVICDDPRVLRIYNDPTVKTAYEACQGFLSGHRLGETVPASEACVDGNLVYVYRSKENLRAFEACHGYFRRYTRTEGRPASHVCGSNSILPIFSKAFDGIRSAFMSCHRYLTQNWQGDEGRSPAGLCSFADIIAFFDTDDTRTSRRSFDLCHRFWRTHRSLRGDGELIPASWMCSQLGGASWFESASRRRAYEQCNMFVMNHRISDEYDSSCSQTVLEIYMNSDNRTAFEACYIFISSQPQVAHDLPDACSYEQELIDIYKNPSSRRRFEACWQRSLQGEYSGDVLYRCMRESSTIDDREPTRSERRSHSASDH